MQPSLRFARTASDTKLSSSDPDSRYIRRVWAPRCREQAAESGKQDAAVLAKLTVIGSWVESFQNGEDKTPEGMQLQAEGETEIRGDI